MGLLKRDEKKRLVAELIDELITGPDPMEDYDKFMMYDMIIIEALLFGILYVVSSVRDVVTASLSFTVIMAVIFVYTYFKSIKRQEATLGKMFMESTTYIGDSDIVEQIEIEGWELLLAPAEVLEKDKLVYERDDLMETLTALKQPGIRVGGGPINAPVVEELAKVRADKFIDEYKRKEAEKKTERKWFGFKKKKPVADISKLEDDRDAIFDLIENIDFEIMGDDYGRDDGEGEEEEG